MAVNDNQHQKYAYEVIPLLFHNETRKFFTYIQRDGTEFLKFWWNRAGLNMDENLRSSPEGIDFQLRTYKDGREVVLVKLPPPKNEKEAYFLALVNRPAKRSIWPWKNLARAFALRKMSGPNGDLKPSVVELTKTARSVPLHRGSRPTINAFYKAICEELESKKTKKKKNKDRQEK